MVDTSISEIAQKRNSSLGSTLRRAGGSLAYALLPLARSLPLVPTWRLETLAGGRFKLETHVPNDRQIMPGARNALLVTHDLSASGAPILLLEIARVLLDGGWQVSVISLARGELTKDFVDIGATVIVDQNVGEALRQDLSALSVGMDLAICNTVASKSAVDALSPLLPTLWYLHEVSLLRDLLSANAGLARSFRSPALVWAGSEISAEIVRPCRPDVEVVPYGLDSLSSDAVAPLTADSTAKLSVFGSFETRKGQDLLVEALQHLSDDERSKLAIVFYGRVLDEPYYAKLRIDAQRYPQISFGGELDREAYHAALLSSDAVVVPSRDDTLPLVSLDALGAARVLMCTATTGTSGYIDSGESGYVATEPSPRAIAAMLSQALREMSNWSDIAQKGQAVFHRSFSRSAFVNKLRTTCDALLSDSWTSDIEKH